MRHDPAVGSRLAGSSGGSTSNGPTDLSQPATNSEAAHETIARRCVQCVPGVAVIARLKVIRIEQPRTEGRGLADVASVEHSAGSDPHRQVLWHVEGVHQSAIQ